MSRGSNWIGMDKNLKQDFKSIRREFSLIEAMFSYSLDIDNGNDGTVSGYSKLWSWSRNKVRRFIKNIQSDAGHLKDSKRTAKGHPIHFIDNDLWNKKDRGKTGKGQGKDTTINPLILQSYNPKEKITSEIINFTTYFVDKIFKLHKEKSPAKSNKLIQNSVLTIGRLISIDGFELGYIKKICDWGITDKFYKRHLYSLSTLRYAWKNHLTTFQNMAHSYDERIKDRIDGKDQFDGNIYIGTPEDEIDFLDN